MNTGEILIYQSKQGDIRLDVHHETKTTPEESDVYRNEYMDKRYDPSRGRTFSCCALFLFYKHVIPPGLKIKTTNLII